MAGRMARHGPANRLQLHPGGAGLPNELRQRYTLAAISDAQSAWCLPEMRAARLGGYLGPLVVSRDFRYRKSTLRFFSAALAALPVDSAHALFVGNDRFRDVCAARQLDVTTVLVSPNQRTKQAESAKPDYLTHRLAKLRQAAEFLERQGTGLQCRRRLRSHAN